MEQAKGSVASSEELTAKFITSEKLLEAARVEVACLTEETFRAGTEKTESDEVTIETCRESEWFLLRLSVALATQNRAEKLTCLLVAEFTNALDEAVQQLSPDVINRLQHGMERA